MHAITRYVDLLTCVYFLICVCILFLTLFLLTCKSRLFQLLRFCAAAGYADCGRSILSQGLLLLPKRAKQEGQ